MKIIETIQSDDYKIDTSFKLKSKLTLENFWIPIAMHLTKRIRESLSRFG